MTITRLRTVPVEFPYDPPIGLAPGRMLRTGSCVLTILDTDEGVSGEGLVYTFNGTDLARYDAAIRGFAPLVVGREPRADTFARAWQTVRAADPSDFAVSALAALDMALWDLRARLAGVNVSALIGAHHKTLPVYDSGSYWVSVPPDALRRNAQASMERGFRAFKLRIGGNLDDDLPRVRALREAIGPDCALLADLNQKSTVADAIRIGHALEPFGLTWLEEPVPCHDHKGEAEIAAALDVTIASGESIYTSDGILEMLKLKSADVVMPDLQRMGGPTGFLEAARHAQAFGVPCSNHCFTEMSAGLLAGVPNANWLEYMLWLEPIYRERILLDGNGHAVLPTAPGWGFSFDWDAVKRYAVSL